MQQYSSCVLLMAYDLTTVISHQPFTIYTLVILLTVFLINASCQNYLLLLTLYAARAP